MWTGSMARNRKIHDSLTSCWMYRHKTFYTGFLWPIWYEMKEMFKPSQGAFRYVDRIALQRYRDNYVFLNQNLSDRRILSLQDRMHLYLRVILRFPHWKMFKDRKNLQIVNNFKLRPRKDSWKKMVKQLFDRFLFFYFFDKF